MIFSRKRNQFNNLPPLTLSGGIVPRVHEARFLGVIFDDKMSWLPQTNKVAKKMSSRIPFLRSVAAKSWGSHPMTLIRTYQALIRSVSDYAAGIWDPATKKAWKIIQTKQNEALRICIGAMKSTPINALTVECGELKVQRRNQLLLDRTITRFLSSSNHPIKGLVLEWTDNAAARKTPLIISRYSNLPVDREAIFSSPLPLCYSTSYEVRTTSIPIFTSFPPQPLQASNQPLTSKELFEELRKTVWIGLNILATDGSKSEREEDGVGAAMVDLSKNPIYAKMARLSQSSSIFRAEAKAMEMATSYLLEQPSHPTIILSDNQSLLTKLKNQAIEVDEEPFLVKIRINLHQLATRNQDVRLAWVPSHCGIKPNEAADTAAKVARVLGTPCPDLLLYRDLYSNIKKYYTMEWQEEWNTEHTGRNLYRLNPIAGNKAWVAKFPDFPKRTLGPLSRARLGHSMAPASLARFKIVDNGLCPRCGEEATTTHLLDKCQFTDKTQFEDHLNIFKIPQPHDFDHLMKQQDSKLIIQIVQAYHLLLQSNPHIKI